MGQYKYIAINPAGEEVRGLLQAELEQHVFAALEAQGLTPLSIAPVAASSKTQLFARKRIKRADIVNMTSQLASLMQAKLPLVKALDALQRTAHPSLGVLLADISSRVAQGEPLALVLEKYPQHFPPLYRSMVQAGEAGGIFPEALKQVAANQERDLEARSKMKGAMTYPLIMVAVMLLSVVVLLTFVIPRFTGVFAGMGVAMPLPTRALIFISDGLIAWWWLIAGVGLALFGLVRTVFARPEGRLKVERYKLRLPGVGGIVRDMSLARFLGSLGALLDNGVPMLEALEATRDVAGNGWIMHALGEVQKEVSEGEALSVSLSARGELFPDLVQGMVGTGEEAGNLPEMLLSAGEYYAREGGRKIATLTTMAEPVIILVMGLMVGFVIISMLLPIFQMTMSVK